MLGVKSILIVCHGNICRSPMAEGFFTHHLREKNSITVTSAGISAIVNHSADSHALTIMHNNGIDISAHRARQLSDSLVRQADLIFVMTHSQLKIVANQFITSKGKTFLLGHWRGFEILDPYKQNYEVFEKVYQQINLAWQDWKARILSCTTHV